MSHLAFKPDGILAPDMVLDRKKWFKKKAANKACELLNLPPCEDLNNFGCYIISYNASFKNMILASITTGEVPFPAIVKDQDEEALNCRQFRSTI